MPVLPNEADRSIWNRLFAYVPLDWRTAPPSQAMLECTKFLGRHGVRTVLDIGCGVGRWSMHFAKTGFAVSGSDFADLGIEYARRWAADEGVAIRYRCCPLTEEAFPGARFDAVVAALVMDNVTREEMTLGIERMHAALQPDGVAFALFNPSVSCDQGADVGDPNPTRGTTSVVYSDAELRSAFPAFTVLDMRRYEMGMRGVYLQCGPPSRPSDLRGMDLTGASA